MRQVENLYVIAKRVQRVENLCGVSTSITTYSTLGFEHFQWKCDPIPPSTTGGGRDIRLRELCDAIAPIGCYCMHLSSDVDSSYVVPTLRESTPPSIY